MDLIDKGKEVMGSVERMLAGLPGIKGYKEKEMRREADKKVRDTIVARLEPLRTRITGLQHDLLSGGGLLWLDDMERVVGKLQLLMDRVRTAAYGYAPFFDLERVKEGELDRLVEYDRSLIEALPGLEESVGELEKAVRANDAIQTALQAVATQVTGLGERFSRRMEAIHEAG